MTLLPPHLPVSQACRRLFHSGAWAVVLAALLSAGIAVRFGRDIAASRGRHALGDGQTPATYGFDLSACRLPHGQIVAGGMPRDGVPAMTNPGTIAPGEAEQGRLLKSNDRVVGVVVNGEARAYPVSILNWHEIVNDLVGGVAIAVTYSPLCDSVVVFERDVEGRRLEFRVSGLLWNSNLLMYDRQPDGRRESLWSQLLFRAVAGPAAEAGTTLRRIPCALAPWHDWKTRYPTTRVLAPDPARRSLYKRQPYGSYFGSDDLRFPVSPLPPDGWPRKTRILAIPAGDRFDVLSAPAMIRQADGRRAVHRAAAAPALLFHCHAESATVWASVEGSERPADVVYAFWFAWYAAHPTALPPS